MASQPTLAINLCETLEDWLESHFAAGQGSSNRGKKLVDVGGYHGDFALRFMEKGHFDDAIIFEPNPENYAHTKRRFQGNAKISIECAACDDQNEEREFFCAGETYTGSLLPYDTATPTPVARSVVKCVTLDGYLANRKAHGDIGLLKIDTQGNDLRVLKGASETLRLSRPWIVVEMIYVSLYARQAATHELASWLAERDYVLGAQFNEFYTAEGWLAWSDACFIPREFTARFTEPFQARATSPRRRSRWRRWFGR
jgi:FkbM family methyltransferase